MSDKTFYLYDKNAEIKKEDVTDIIGTIKRNPPSEVCKCEFWDLEAAYLDVGTEVYKTKTSEQICAIKNGKYICYRLCPSEEFYGLID